MKNQSWKFPVFYDVTLCLLKTNNLFQFKMVPIQLKFWTSRSSAVQLSRFRIWKLELRELIKWPISNLRQLPMNVSKMNLQLWLNWIMKVSASPRWWLVIKFFQVDWFAAADRADLVTRKPFGDGIITEESESWWFPEWQNTEPHTQTPVGNLLRIPNLKQQLVFGFVIRKEWVIYSRKNCWRTHHKFSTRNMC